MRFCRVIMSQGDFLDFTKHEAGEVEFWLSLGYLALEMIHTSQGTRFVDHVVTWRES
jgi:hypothetical protein